MQRPVWLLLAIALGMLLNPLNSSMISVAIARFQHVFGLSFATVSWLISSYYLASAIAQPVMGKVADLFGHKRLFLIGLGLVALSSVTAPFSPSFAWLVVFRLIQAVGSSVLFPAGMAIVRHQVSDRQAKALAFLAVFSSGAAAFGPTIGGVLLHSFDWPAIFTINLPIIAAAFCLALWALPRDPRRWSQAADGEGPRSVLGVLDFPGILLFALTIVGILMFLLSFGQGVNVYAGVVGVLALAGFVWRELDADSPFIRIRMFTQNRLFLWVHIQFAVVNVIFYSFFFGMPTYLQEVRGFDAQQTGLLMLCLAGVSVLVAPLTGAWVDRSGSRPGLLLSGVLMTLGALGMTTFHQASPLALLIAVLLVLGVSNGLNNVGMQAALFASAPKEIIGAASGLFMTARYMGTIISSVLLGMVFGSSLTTGRLRILAGILVVFAASVIWMSWRLPKGRPQQAG
ncbi:MFS transporter [Alicyclobacillus shizuokensis]|uniref:MFS transporter n=1 Tax=Alicyclobacillus shizuokensis TaxID=392014 RepID=UPI00082C81F2|nr:MFS transporter [Alicyclobacillus shizuokensis]